MATSNGGDDDDGLRRKGKSTLDDHHAESCAVADFVDSAHSYAIMIKSCIARRNTPTVALEAGASSFHSPVI